MLPDVKMGVIMNNFQTNEITDDIEDIISIYRLLTKDKKRTLIHLILEDRFNSLCCSFSFGNGQGIKETNEIGFREIIQNS